MSQSICTIRITLCNTKPPIWLRVAVSADITIGQLHEEHDDIVEWLGEDFDPEAFDIE